MYNAASKLIIGTGIAILLASCSGSSNGSQAEALTLSADSAINAGNYTLATQLLDTLKSRFPHEIKAQRAALNLRARANEGMIITEIQSTDSLEARYNYMKDSLQQYFTFVNNPELVEGYYVIKEMANSSLFSRTGVEARITPEGSFYMISSLAGNPVKHTSISVQAGGATAQSADVAYDGDRNYRSGNTEMITFMASECDTIGKIMSANQGSPAKLIFNGTRAYSVAMPKNDARSIALAYEFSQALIKSRRLAAKKELLDRQLMLARDQAARTSQDN